MNEPLCDGTWCHESQEFAGELDFTVVDTRRQRIVSFITASIDPIRRVPIPMWYRQDGDRTIYTRTNPLEEWSADHCHFDGEIFYWINPVSGEHPWTRILEWELPDWIESRLSQTHAKMEEQQKTAEQGTASKVDISGTGSE